MSIVARDIKNVVYNIPDKEVNFTCNGNHDVLVSNVPAPAIIKNMLDINSDPYTVDNKIGFKVNDLRMPLNEDVIPSEWIKISPTTNIIVPLEVNKFSLEINGFLEVQFVLVPINASPKAVTNKYMFETIAYPDVYFEAQSEKSVFGLGWTSKSKKQITFQFFKQKFVYNAISNYDMIFNCVATNRGIKITSVNSVNNKQLSYSGWKPILDRIKINNSSISIAKWSNIRRYTGESGLMYFGQFNETRYISSELGVPGYVQQDPVLIHNILLVASERDVIHNYKGVPTYIFEYHIKNKNHNVKYPSHMKLLGRPFEFKYFKTDYPRINKMTLGLRLLFTGYKWQPNDHILYYMMHYGLFSLMNQFIRWVSCYYNRQNEITNGKQMCVGNDLLIILIEELLSKYDCPICKSSHDIRRDCGGSSRVKRYVASINPFFNVGETITGVVKYEIRAIYTSYCYLGNKKEPKTKLCQQIAFLLECEDARVISRVNFLVSQHFTWHDTMDVYIKMNKEGISMRHALRLLRIEHPEYEERKLVVANSTSVSSREEGTHVECSNADNVKSSTSVATAL